MGLSMQIANLVNLKSGRASGVCVWMRVCACLCMLGEGREGVFVFVFVFPLNRTVSKRSTGCLLLLINGSGHCF